MKPILQALTEAIERGSAKAKTQALWHTCDVLMSGHYTEDEIWTFGEVIDQLTREIESKVRSALAERMARADNAPPQTIRKLAMDDSIAVAGRVLQYSERVDVRTLVACARTKSQQHLLAISKRSSLPEAVTDILVERGSKPVVRSVAANAGARFSQTGFLDLLRRSENDSILADVLGARKDIPRQLFQQIIAKAGDEAKARLSRPGDDDAAVGEAIASVTGELQAKFGPASQAYFTAKRKLAALHRQGGLSEDVIRRHAEAHQLEETIVCLSLLTSLGVDVVERALTQPSRELALVLAKSLGLGWDTTMAILFVTATNYKMRASEIDAFKDQYARLEAAAAREVLRCYATRRSAAAKPAPQTLQQLHAG